ncbi:MAG: bifunctional [glutamine synthetase] adenylyltransferase/[glutamine synthetase]-adenylyl-L-tyrosine phosphorylase [Pontimonas sp.]
MPRGLGLSELARLGFAELTEARNRLDQLGIDAEPFAAAAHPDRAVEWWQRLREVDPSLFDTHLGSEAGRDPLIRLVGASDGLAEFLKRRPEVWPTLAQTVSGPRDRDEVVAQWRGEIAGLDYDQSVVALRVAYRRELMRLALWDTVQHAPIDAVDVVARGLADLADAAIEVAIDIARAQLGLSSDDVPLAVIAMGKAGARELNYLSDVDVIYVTEATDPESQDTVLRGATALAQSLQRIIGEFSSEPGLWEVDANLRPEGKDGALVRTLDSHVAYYQRWAKDWEFQALIKARPMAGSMELGARYRQALEPLIWAASTRQGFVEQVQRMRERVTEHIPADEVDIQLKLGPGGLRDVEFTIQLLQLVHGGADPDVRVPDTLGALRALASKGYVGRPEAAEFDRAYRLLRTLEHRLQLRHLKRTHLMPRDEEDLRILARASKIAENAESLVERWRETQRQVRSLHEKLFYRPLLQAIAGLGTDEGVELTSEQAADRLRATGFVDPEGAINHITALTQGVSRRAQIQRNLLPVILRWLADGTDPDRGLLAFRRLSDNLGESNWFLRMLRDSSGAAQRLTRVLATSGYVGALLERVPDGAGWLDNPDDLVPRERETLLGEVASIAERYQDDVDSGANALRQLRRRELLRLAMASIVGEIETIPLGNALTELTEVYLEGAWRLAAAAMEGVEFAIIAMGRFGGGELGFASDADVVYVVRDGGAGDDTHNRGIELVREITRITEDVLFPFELDAGLRPEGKNGPMVRSLDAYQAYYDRWALSWEAQALLRARYVVGDESLRTDFMAMANSIRYPDAFPSDALREIRRIKARVESERLPQGADPTRHVKLGRGSLSDVEWLVQLLQLRYAGHHESLRRADTLGTLHALAEEGVVPDADVTVLSNAWLLSSELRNALTLFRVAPDVLPVDRHVLEGAARLMGYPPRSASRLEEHYLRTTRLSRQAFERHFFE